MVKTNLPSFIVTLATNFMVLGATLGFSRLIAQVTSSSIVQSESARAVFAAKWGQANISILWWIGLPRWSAAGCSARPPSATGSTPPAATSPPARGAGVPVERVKIVLFVLTGFAAAFVGVLQGVQWNSGNSTYGQGYVFQAPIVVVIGGVLLGGGYGSVIGIFLGTAIFGVISTGIFYTGWSTDWVQPLPRRPARRRGARQQLCAPHGARRPLGGRHGRPPRRSSSSATSPSPSPASRALDGVSLAVEPGKILCLLGDNGAGKSTLIKVLSGYHQPTLGHASSSTASEIRFAGPRDARKRGIATVHQDVGSDPADEHRPELLPRRRADQGRPAVPPSRHRRTANRIAIEQIRRFGITRITNGDQLVGTMSGGERQVLAIGRAMYFGARVLILDEPTSALGVKEASIVLRLMTPGPGGRRRHRLHHPQCQPRDDRRRPLRRPDPGPGRGRVSPAARSPARRSST